MLKSKKNNKKKYPLPVSMFTLIGMPRCGRAELLQMIVKKHGNIVKLPWNMANYIVFNELESIQHILLDNFSNFARLDPFYTRLKQLLGSGLLTNVDPSWQAQRQLLQPHFHLSTIAPMIGKTATITAKHLANWDTLANKNKKFDIAHNMSALTVKLAGELLFNVDLSSIASDFASWIRTCNRQISYSLFTYPRWFPTLGNLRFRYTLHSIYKLVKKIITDRLAQPCEKSDLLSLIMQSKDPLTQEPRSVEFMVEEALTFLVTAYESLATSLGWTWYLLANHPEIYQKFLHEVDGLQNKPISTQEDLAKLTYTKCIVNESLRLYPPIWGIARRSINDDEICGYFIPAGSSLIFSSYVMHRDERYWPEPNTFMPERFSEENSKNRLKYTFIPFGGGPRICIGSNLAIMQAQIILTTIAQHYEISLPAQKIELECLVTMKSLHGIQAIASKRNIPVAN